MESITTTNHDQGSAEQQHEHVVDWSHLSADILGHISEWYSFPLFRYSHLVLTRDFDVKCHQLHGAMIRLLYGYSRYDPSRQPILLFNTLDLTGYIYDYRAKEHVLTNGLVYQMVPFGHVRGVNLMDCSSLNDRVLDPFANSPKLKQLVLRGVRIGDEAFMRHVSRCRKLETLDLSNTQVSSRTMNKLFSGDFPCLRRLDLSFVEDEFCRDDMDQLFQNHQLVYLSVFENSYRPRTMKRIFRSRTLKQLKFDHDKRLSNRALIECIQGSTIPNLFFETRRIFDCHEQLASNRYLTELSLSAVNAEDYKIQALWTSKTLKGVTLFLESDDRSQKLNYMKGIESNESIVELHLLRCAQFDLSPLKHNDKIRELTLISASINDQDLVELCSNKDLVLLNVFHNKIVGLHCPTYSYNQFTTLATPDRQNHFLRELRWRITRVYRWKLRWKLSANPRVQSLGPSMFLGVTFAIRCVLEARVSRSNPTISVAFSKAKKRRQKTGDTWHIVKNIFHSVKLIKNLLSCKIDILKHFISHIIVPPHFTCPRDKDCGCVIHKHTKKINFIICSN